MAELSGWSSSTALQKYKQSVCQLKATLDSFIDYNGSDLVLMHCDVQLMPAVDMELKVTFYSRDQPVWIKE